MMAGRARYWIFLKDNSFTQTKVGEGNQNP
jgi:hypothetical protein